MFAVQTSTDTMSIRLIGARARLCVGATSANRMRVPIVVIACVRIERADAPALFLVQRPEYESGRRAVLKDR
jgi:hypothetical protein